MVGGTTACPGKSEGAAGSLQGAGGGSYPPGGCACAFRAARAELEAGATLGQEGLKDVARPEAPGAAWCHPGALLPFYRLVSSSLGEQQWSWEEEPPPHRAAPGMLQQLQQSLGEMHLPARPMEQESCPCPPRPAALPSSACISSLPLLRLPWKWQSKRFAERIRASPAASWAAPASLGPCTASPGQTPSLSQTFGARPPPQHSWPGQGTALLAPNKDSVPHRGSHHA